MGFREAIAEVAFTFFPATDCWEFTGPRDAYGYGPDVFRNKN